VNARRRLARCLLAPEAFGTSPLFGSRNKLHHFRVLWNIDPMGVPQLISPPGGGNLMCAQALDIVEVVESGTVPAQGRDTCETNAAA
jgi:hypothetical protein